MPRNSSGVYTLPTGNPVVTGTLIEAVWANDTLADVRQALTDSLDRYGRGGMLAPFKIDAGTAAAPGLSFSAEASTGLFRPGAGVLGFATVGVSRMTLNASGLTSTVPWIGNVTGDVTGNVTGNVTGTVTGASSLNVLKAGDTMTGALAIAAGAAATPGLAVSGDANTGFWSPGADTLAASTNGAERVRIDSGGRVGIGLTPLTSSGANALQLQIGDPTATSGSGLTLGATVTSDIAFADGVSGASQYAGLIRYAHATDFMSLWTGAVERMRINSSGNVGVGTITPQGRLDVSSTGATRIRASSSGANNLMRGFEFGVEGTSQVYGSTTMDLNSGELRHEAGYATWGGFHTFYTNGLERARIMSTGPVVINATTNVGIGGGADHFAVQGTIGLTTQLNASPGPGVDFQFVNRSTGGFKFYTNAGAAISFTIVSGAPTNSMVLAGNGTLQLQNGLEDGTSLLKITNSTAGSAEQFYVNHTLGDVYIGNKRSDGSTNLILRTHGASSSTVKVQHSGESAYDVGFRDLPPVTGWKHGACFYTTIGVTVDTSVAGRIFSVYNNSASPITLTQGTGVTLRLGGTTTTGSRTLAARGVANIWFLTPTEAICTGNVS